MLIPSKFNGYSKDGIRLYPFDTGGGSQQSTTSSTELPSWAQPYAQGTLQKADALTSQPYQPYTGNRIAGFSPLQQYAQDQASNMQPSQQLQSATQLAMAAGQTGMNTAYNGQQFGNTFQAPGQYNPGQFTYQQTQAPQLQNYQMQGPQNVQSQNLTTPTMQGQSTNYNPNLQNYQMQAPQAVQAQNIQGPALNNLSMQAADKIQGQQVNAPTMNAAQTNFNPNLQNYQMQGPQDVSSSKFDTNAAQQGMNPYLQQALDPQIAAAQRQSAINQTKLAGQAVGAGAFGGSRFALEQAEEQKNLGTNLANITGQGYNTAYNNAAQQFNTQNAQALQAQQANQQAGLATGQQNLAANLQTQQLGTQTGLQSALANLNNQQQANVQNQATQFQANGMNAQQAMQAALANQQNQQQANLQNLSAGLQTQGLQAQTGMQAQQSNQQANLQAGLANQQAGLTTGQQNLSANLSTQQLGTQTGLQTALANLNNQQQAAVQNQAAQLQTQGMSSQQALQAGLANQQAGLTTGQQNLSANLQTQQLGTQTGLQTALANLNNQQQAAVQNQAAQLQTQGMSSQQALQAALANQQAGLTTGQQNLAANLQTQQLGAGQNMQSQLANQQQYMAAQQAQQQANQFGYGQGMTAAQTAAQYGLGANQLNAQQQQFGASLGLQGAGLGLNAANSLNNLGQNQYTQNMGINQLQNQYGAQQQAQQQQGLSQAYQDFLNQKNYDYNQLGYMSNMIRGLPLGTTSNQQVYPGAANMIGAVGGLGMGAAGLMNQYSKMAKEGGLMNSYAEGGDVQSAGNIEGIIHKLSDQQLVEAQKNAQARNDGQTLQAIMVEQGIRASERNGLAGAFNQTAQGQEPVNAAKGGIMGFAVGGDPMGTGSEEIMSESSGKKDNRNIFERIVGAPADPEWKQELAAKKESKKSQSPASKADEDRVMADYFMNQGKPEVVQLPVQPPVANRMPAGSITTALPRASETSVEDSTSKMFKQLQELGKPEQEALNKMIESHKKRIDDMQARGLNDALTQFGFQLAAASSKPGTSLFRALGEAAPSITESLNKNQQSVSAAQENMEKLQMDQARYNLAMKKGDMQSALGYAQAISADKKAQQQLELQRQQLGITAAHYAKPSTATEFVYSKMRNDPTNTKLSDTEIMNMATRATTGYDKAQLGQTGKANAAVAKAMEKYAMFEAMPPSPYRDSMLAARDKEIAQLQGQQGGGNTILRFDAQGKLISG